MPKLTDTARQELLANITASVDQLAEDDRAVDVMAAFLDGEALFVLTRDQLRVLPAGTNLEPPAPAAPAADDRMPGNYL